MSWMLGQKILVTISNLKIAYLEGTNIVKNSDKEKYGRYGITFDSAGSWSFDNDFAKNVITFDADNSSSSDSEYRNITF